MLNKYPTVVQSMHSTILCHELRVHHNALELQKAFVENFSCLLFIHCSKCSGASCVPSKKGMS